MARVTFTKATEFLAEQLQSGSSFRRVGVVLRASLDNVVDGTSRLDNLVQTAWDKLDAALEHKFADFSDDNQRIALRFSLASSLRLSERDQLEMLDKGRNSLSVTSAAAKQRQIPVEVQRFLAIECSSHKASMAALAQNCEIDIQTLEILASNPDREVRIVVAANLAGRMRLDEPNMVESKLAVYNALLNHYESALAEYLVPVCRDEDQLAQMYSLTDKTPSNLRVFVDNPYVSGHLLQDISTSVRLRFMQGGSEVVNNAMQQVDKRFLAENDTAPTLY